MSNQDKYSLIPAELKTYNNWVCWRLVSGSDSPGIRKIPINPKTGKPAKSNDPNTWGSFDQAIQAIDKYDCQYPGIMFQRGMIWGLDIDHCIEGGVISDDANEIIDLMDSYTEISPSGSGIHILAYGQKPEGACRKGNVEMYDSGRGFTVTGNSLGNPKPLRDCTDAAKLVHERFIASKPKKASRAAGSRFSKSEAEIMDAALRSKKGDEIQALMDGDWIKYNSQSQGDLALCNHLAFFTGKDPQMMDSIFRSSGLYRPKWDEKRGDHTYGEITIQRAIADCTAVYTSKEEVSQQRIAATLRAATALPVVVKPDGTKEYSMDDTGNARRLYDTFKHKIRYSHRERVWRVYNGKRWTEDDLNELKRMADEVIEVMAETPIPAGTGFFGLNEWAKHLKRTKSSSGKECMIKETQHLDGIAITPDMLDKDPLLINVLNGTFNLRTGQLQKHDQKDMITKQASVIYDPAADCPLWEKCLGTVFDGDLDLIRYFQAAVGYSMTALTREQCFFILYGNGQNGKSTIIETLITILGDYAMSANPETFMVKDRTGGANPEVVRLKGARFVSTIEAQENMRFNEALLKQMTGGDTTVARPLYSKEIQFKTEFKLWMATNHKPVIKGNDYGIWRRIRLIPFTVKIPDDQKDRDLPDKLLKEASGIFNWMIEGYNDYVRYGLESPQAVLDAVAEYRSEMDILEAFISDCVQPSETGSITSGDVYRCYQEWCRENGFKGVMNQIKFGRELNKYIPSERARDGKRYNHREFTEVGRDLIHDFTAI